MSKIRENYFMAYCTKKGFQKESFLKNLYSIKRKGLERIIEDNKIIRHSFFDENLDFINSLIHSIKYYSDVNYRNDKSSRRNLFLRYNAREVKSFFKEFPELNNLELAEYLKKIVFEESCIQHTLISYKTFRDNLKFYSLKETIDFIFSLKKSGDEWSIRYSYGAYVFVKNGFSYFMISSEDMSSLKKMNILETIQWSVGRKSFPKQLELSGNYLENIVNNYKKQIIKNKMNVFSFC